MDFGEAIKALKEGRKVQREGWNGKNMWIEFNDPDWVGKHSTIRQHAFITLILSNGEFQPGWNASTPDILSEDWKIVD